MDEIGTSKRTRNDLLTDHYFRSLNRNIILIIIIVSIIPLILVSSTIFYQFRVSYQEKVFDHLRELVLSHTQKIDSFLQEKLSDIRFLTHGCGLDILEDESFLQKRLEALQKDFGRDFVDLGVVNADGKQIAYAGPFKLARADYSQAEWFRRAIQSEYYISDVFFRDQGFAPLYHCCAQQPGGGSLDPAGHNRFCRLYLHGRKHSYRANRFCVYPE
jgi:two-component system NtrC family sensor kinase